MLQASISFLRAAHDICDWLHDIIETPVSLHAAGHPAQGADVALSPWHMRRPSAQNDVSRRQLMAEGLFCVTLGPKDPTLACARLDKLFFAASASDQVMLVDKGPTADFWHSPPGLTLTLARHIIPDQLALRPGRVEHPLVFDVTPQSDLPSNDRT